VVITTTPKKASELNPTVKEEKLAD
jgi:hypothetical protein